MHAMYPLLKQTTFPAIQRQQVKTLQVNLGYKCNLSCLHCHVNAGPTRREMMDQATTDKIIQYIRQHPVENLDLTGGAPEMSPFFQPLVKAACMQGVHVIDRCNLTVLEEPDQQQTAEFLRDHQVEIVASLPCYTQDNVDAQRGDGVFQSSIRVLKQLNALGYGQNNPALKLTLVYNPTGPFLPPEQNALQADYQQRLSQDFGISFDQLFTITNMPIARFGSTLVSKGQFKDYMQLLKDSYSEQNLHDVMCRTTLSIDYQGYVYDCDFNQMLNMPLGGTKIHIKDLLEQSVEGQSIAVAEHCYGCTAGQGSSCGGAL